MVSARVGSQGALSGRTALVTGASKNLGRAAALALAEAGADVILHAHRDRGGAEGVAREVEGAGVRAAVVVGDISTHQSVRELMQGVVESVGGVDILVNNAAIRPNRPFLELDEEAIRTVFGVNLFGAYFLALEVVPKMIEKGWGRIINVSGVDGAIGGRLRTHIAASKAGLIGFTKSLALELAAHGITVNCIAPGPFQTTRTPEWFPGWESPAAWDQAHVELMPVKRFGEPKEFGWACTFLASPMAGYITGQTIHLNGGSYMP
jgi:NAD(P)-dependent dehydrogenase (short-subunit alcohol dehydrogenase family)